MTSFNPYARWICEHTRPQSGAAFLGGNIPREIRFDESIQPEDYVHHAVERAPEGIPAFGRVIGFIIHWSPNQRSRYRRDGQWEWSIIDSIHQ
jgi:hypothetical protein